MDDKKKKCLEAAGWRVGDVQDFLDLSDEDMLQIKRRYEAEKKRTKAENEYLRAALEHIAAANLAFKKAAIASRHLGALLMTHDPEAAAEAYREADTLEALINEKAG